MTHRLFVAIRPPGPVRDLLIDRMERLDSARWQDEDQLHLTLRFIGEVDRHALEDVASALDALRQPNFALAISGVGHFERRGRVHSLWAGVRAPGGGDEALRSLQRSVESACRHAGLAPETRKYTPHVTLARFGSGGGREVGEWIAQCGDLQSEPWTVEDFFLYESHLGSAGALYQPLARYQLTDR